MTESLVFTPSTSRTVITKHRIEITARELKRAIAAPTDAVITVETMGYGDSNVLDADYPIVVTWEETTIEEDPR